MTEIIHERESDSSTGVLVAVVVILLVGVVGWIAYNKGAFDGGATPADNNDNGDVIIDLGGNDTTPPADDSTTN